MEELYKQNYIKCLSYIQRSYVLAYSSSLLLLSFSLTVSEANGLQSFPLPFFELELPRLIAVFVTASFYIMLGFIIFFLNWQLSKIRLKIPRELSEALATYPSISNTSKLFQVIIVLGLILIFIVMFKSGQKPLDWYNAIGSSVTVSFGYLLSLTPNKWFNKTAKNAAV